jgi:nucleotidyltransferase/DNA polymerase involved in DNA repair
MANPHFIDLNQYRLDRYKNILERAELLPGRRMLKEKITERFEKISGQGIENLYDLVTALKSSKTIQRLSERTDIPEEYLVILKRELSRFLPKSVYLSDFPGVSPVLIKKLHKMGIQNSLQIFDYADTIEKRKLLSKEIDEPVSALDELVNLSDVSRIWGVGPVFCRIFIETGTDTVKKIALANASELYEQLISVNKTKGYTKAIFTEKDITHCIDIAKELPKTIEN